MRNGSRGQGFKRTTEEIAATKACSRLVVADQMSLWGPCGASPKASQLATSDVVPTNRLIRTGRVRGAREVGLYLAKAGGM